MPRCVARKPCSMPATTGIRSSCKAPRRWPMSCGRILASARPTTSSRRAAPARTYWAARSALPSCCAPARSMPCRGSSPRSRRIAGRSPRRSCGGDRRLPPRSAPTIAEGTAIAQPIRLTEVLGTLRETQGGAVMLSEAEIAAATLDLARMGIYVEPTSAQAAAAFGKLLDAGTITPEQTTVIGAHRQRAEGHAAHCRIARGCAVNGGAGRRTAAPSPYPQASAYAMKLADLPTPCLVLDRGILQRNIDAMARALSRHGVPLRPHMKTAKSIDVARLGDRETARRHHRLHPGRSGIFRRARHRRHPVCGRHHAAEARPGRQAERCRCGDHRADR